MNTLQIVSRSQHLFPILYTVESVENRKKGLATPDYITDSTRKHSSFLHTDGVMRYEEYTIVHLSIGTRYSNLRNRRLEYQ
jgi:hypothetical protein